MDFNATIDLIIKDLNEAREIIDDLKKYSGVPVLQVELAKSKCKSAAEIIALLKTVSNNEIPVASETLPEPLPQPETKPRLQPKPKPEPKPQPEPDPKPQPISDSHPHVNHHEDNRTHTVGDSFGHLSSRLNEQMGSSLTESDVSEILKSKPLSNLSDAIGVNDRFLFIREVFNDNKEAYSQAISRLDSAENLTDARAVIMSYTGDSNENEAVKQLLDLVKRKLSSNE